MTPSIQRALRSALLVLAAALYACGGGGDSAPAPGGGTPQPGETIGQVINSSLKSEVINDTYSIQVYLPASYAAGTASLPAIYVTEGDAPYGSSVSGGSGFGGTTQSRFDAFKQAMQRRGTQAILVGISGTNRRDRDFLLPGAANYLNFIAKELAPSVERQYRADPKRRALSGLSHGGYFVVAALVLEGTAGSLSFSHYLSTESSFGAHGNSAAYFAYEKQLDGKALPATLFLASAIGSNGPLVSALHAQMLAQANPGLSLVRAAYDASHVGADLPAFEEALARFYP